MKKQKKSQKEITLVGYFPEDARARSNGEAQKGINVYNLLKKGGYQVEKISTSGWKRRPVSLLFLFWKACRHSQNLLIVTSDKGAKTFITLGRLLGGKKINIVYLMVGVGTLKNAHLKVNLPDFASIVNRADLWAGVKTNKKKHFYSLANVVAVETPSLQKMYETIYGLSNVSILTNFRMESPCIERSEKPKTRKINLVYFSRIVPSKGLDDLIASFQLLPADIKNAICIDIYGSNDNEWSQKVLGELPCGVQYKGNLAEKKIVTLSKYDALVFPTKHCEGVPGSIVEALLAGLPVISSRFGMVSDTLTNEVDSLIYDFGSNEGLIDSLVRFASDDRLRDRLKEGALASAKKYTYEESLLILNRMLKEKN